MIHDDAYAIEPWSVTERSLPAPICSPRASPSSRSPTATSACGATSTRASRYGLPGTYLNGVLRAAAAAVRRGRLRLPGVGPDADQRHERQDHPPAGRRRAVRRPLRRAALATSGCSTCAPACCAARSSGSRPPGTASGSARPGSSRSPSARSRRSTTRSSRSTAAPHRRAVGAGRQRAGAGRRRRPARRRGAGSRRCSRRSTAADDASRRCSSHSHAAAAACGWRRRWTTSSRARRARDVDSREPPTTSAGSRSPPSLEPGERLRLVKFLAYGWSSRALAARRCATRSRRRSPRRGTPAGTGCCAEQRDVPRRLLGRAPTSRSRATPSCSRRSASRSSTLLQAGARAEQRAIPAKGLTGPGLRRAHVLGHRDASSCRCSPTRARGGARRAALAPLDARPGARAGRRTLGLEGAAFPWRTIRGQECSGYWPAGTAAFHVNADIADAVIRYVAPPATRTSSATIGLELLVETARLWRSLGHHDAARRASASTGSPGPTSTARSPTTTSTRT